MESQWDFLPQNNLNSTLVNVYEVSIPMKQKEKIKGQKYTVDLFFSSKWLNYKQTEKEIQKNCLELFSPLCSAGHWFSCHESIIEIMMEITTRWNYLSEDCYDCILSKSQNHYPVLTIFHLSSFSPVLVQLFFCQNLTHTPSCLRFCLCVLSISTLG